IGTGGSEQSRIVYIDKGEHHGVKPDMAVITVDGIVGKVLKVFGSTAQVLLIDDQSSGVGGIPEKSRLQGIVRGTPAGEVVLERIMTDNAVQPGEEVRTSGGDRIFPKGLPVGTVTKVGNGTDLFLTIRVKPAANLSKLEEVLVVTKLVEQEPTQLQTGPVRAADILAQRLPSVPDKPATDAAKPNNGAGGNEAANPAPPPAGKPAGAPAPPRAEASPAAANPAANSITVVPPRSTSAPPTALKPAMAHSPAPPPVKVADPTETVAPKVKPASPPATATQPPPQDGPQ
ncbi:MAG TPA: rod shape-determining protein MreC, partial [Terriglobales bacterium]|nr:rod shape-determining protein MreC [Terriglobales bacterium]